MSIKIFRNILVGALALLGLFAGEALAQATSANVTVSAVVPKACRFYVSGSPSISIGHPANGATIDPASSSNATGSTTLTYRCTNTVLPQFNIDGGGYAAPSQSATVTLTGVPSGTMPADITVTGGGAGTGLGSGGGNDKTATIDGAITPANFGGAAVGTYSKTVAIGIQAVP